MAVLAPKMWSKSTQKKLWLDIYVEKRVWAKKSGQLIIPVRSTFHNDLHPPIGGHHPVLYFTPQIKKKYCTAMCYKRGVPKLHIHFLGFPEIPPHVFLGTQCMGIILKFLSFTYPDPSFLFCNAVTIFMDRRMWFMIWLFGNPTLPILALQLAFCPMLDDLTIF